MSGFAESPAAGGRYEVLSSHEKNTLPFNEFVASQLAVKTLFPSCIKRPESRS